MSFQASKTTVQPIKPAFGVKKRGFKHFLLTTVVSRDIMRLTEVVNGPLRKGIQWMRF